MPIEHRRKHQSAENDGSYQARVRNAKSRRCRIARRARHAADDGIVLRLLQGSPLFSLLVDDIRHNFLKAEKHALKFLKLVIWQM